MHKLEGESFEEQLRNSLEGAELSPPDRIWTAIDGEMANMETIRLRKQMVFYRGIAASLLLLIISAVLVAWQLENDKDTLSNKINLAIEFGESGNMIVDHPATIKSQLPTIDYFNLTNDTQGKISVLIANSLIKPEDFNSILSNQSVSGIQYASKNSPSEINQQQRYDREKVNIDQDNNETSTFNLSENAEITQFSRVFLSINFIDSKSIDQIEALFPFDVKNSVKDFYYQMIPTYDFHTKNMVADNTLTNSDSWADFNVRGGVFEPNYQSSQSLESFSPSDFRLSANNNRVPNSPNSFTANSDFRGEDLTAGYSYILSASYAKKLTNRLFLVSGVEYGIYEAITSTNRILSDGGEIRFAVTEQIIADGNIDFQKSNLGIGFENVELNNSFQFASIPVKVGYNVLNKKLSISVSSGLSTGFYLGNSIKDPDNVIEELKVSRRNNSIYRDVNFSFVGGVSFGYKLFDNYLFTLEPTYQRAINSYTRNNSDFSALPENFGISAGMRVFIN